MNLNILAWQPDDIRPTLNGMQFRLMDFSVNKYKWLTLSDIESVAKSDDSIHSKMFRTFMEKVIVREKEVNDLMNVGFEKTFLKKYNDGKYCTAEIVEFHYGAVVSAPRLMKSLAFRDFYHKVPSWGVEDEILIAAKKFGVEDIYLIDDYNSIHFSTTMKKFNLLGESMSWGKTYLPLKHFTIYKYGDKIPSYEKHLKGVKVNENYGRD